MQKCYDENISISRRTKRHEMKAKKEQKKNKQIFSNCIHNVSAIEGMEGGANSLTQLKDKCIKEHL